LREQLQACFCLAADVRAICKPGRLAKIIRGLGENVQLTQGPPAA